MGTLRRSFILGLLFCLTCLSLLQAQTGNKGGSDSNAPAASPTSTGHPPDDPPRKLTELVHAGKYTEAQQLTTGLLVAYPNDQRLIKAKELIEKLLATASQAAQGSSQPVASSDAVQLTGMDKVNYSALIVLARQAKQTTDRSEQTKLLQQFMDQSGVFLQKHPDQMLLWQLRAASAISLDDITAGYEAGQKLLAMGTADSNDSNLQQLLVQLKNKGWLDKDAAEKAQKHAEEKRMYGWASGTWNAHYSETDKQGKVITSSSYDGVAFVRYGSVLEGYKGEESDKAFFRPELRITILNSGEIRCEGWSSCELSDHNETITIVSKEGK